MYIFVHIIEWYILVYIYIHTHNYRYKITYIYKCMYNIYICIQLYICIYNFFIFSGYKPFVKYTFCEQFPPDCGIYINFGEQKFKILVTSHLLNFYAIAFCVLRDLCLAPKLQRYFDVFSSISFIVLHVMFKFILN